MTKLAHSLSAKLRRWADRLDHQDARDARRLGVGLALYRCIRRVDARQEIRVVLDVGANSGEWAATVAKCLPSAELHCFEPQPACQLALQSLSKHNPRVHVHAMALGAQNGRLAMNANRFTPSSSFLRMTKRHVDLWPATADTAEIEVLVRCLDDETSSLGTGMFLKIDVQGYELQVLQGATDTLTRTTLIVAEVLFESLYENQSGVADLIAHLDAQGFRLAEVLHQHRPNGNEFIAYADLAFVSKSILR